MVFFRVTLFHPRVCLKSVVLIPLKNLAFSHCVIYPFVFGFPLERDRHILILSTLFSVYIVTIMSAESHFCPFWKFLSIMFSDIPSPLFLQLSRPFSEALKIRLFILLTFHIPQPHLFISISLLPCASLCVYSDLHAPVPTQCLISLSIPPSSF